MCAQQKPNVVVILSDQHRYDCLGSYGNTEVRTPNLDRLAADGVVFEQAFCPFPVCAPSRYSLLTSLYPHQHTASDNETTLPRGIATFPQLFKQAGYQTEAVGKMHLTPTYADVGFSKMTLAEQHGPGRHDDDYHRYLRQQGLYDGNDLTDQVEEFRKTAPKEYWDSFGAMQSNLPEEHHSTTWIADRAIEAIRRWDSSPQLLFISFVKPHHPFDPPPPWDSLYDPELTTILPGWSDRVADIDKNRGPGYFANDKLTPDALRRVTAFYYATITHMDHHVGRIVDVLRKSGHYDNSVVVYTSDHGEFMGFHHLLLKHNYMYEPLVRVPLVWKLPHGRSAGRRDDSLASLLDVAPTLSGISSVPLPATIAGIDLFSEEKREHIVAESNDEYLVRTKRHKLLKMKDEAQCQLFDLETDPQERRNLFYDTGLSHVRGELERRLADTILFDTFPPASIDATSPTIMTDQTKESLEARRIESTNYFRKRMEG